MNRTQAVLIGAAATILGAAFLVFASAAPAWARAIVGIPFVLLLPGHAVMLSVDPDGQLGGFEWFALAVGGSISITALVSVGLASSVGLTATACALVLAGVTLIALLTSVLLTARQPKPRRSPTRRNSVQRALFGTLAIVTCAFLVLLLSVPIRGVTERGSVIQLWGLPDKAGGLHIGARNISSTSRHYRLTIEQGGRLISQQELNMPAGTALSFDVRKSATWTSAAPVTAVLTDTAGAEAPRDISVWTVE